MSSTHESPSESPSAPSATAEGTVEVATLVFDSGVDILAGARTAVMTQARRQFVWTSDMLDLALTMWADDIALDAICVDGQVLPHADTQEHFTVDLLIEGVAVARSRADVDGCFAFEGLDRGEYQFHLAAEQRTVVAGPITVFENPM